MNPCLLISGWGHGRGPMEMLARKMDLDHYQALSLAELSDENGRADYLGSLKKYLAAAAAPVNVIGWSTGGIIALEAAAACPHLISRIVLLSSTPRFCSAPDFPAGTPDSEVRALAVGMRRDFAKTMTAFIRRAVYPLPVTDEQVADTIAESARQGQKALAAGLSYLRQSDVRDRIAAVQCPCLLLHGAQDKVVPGAAAEWLAANLAAAELHVWEHGGHALLAQFGTEVVEKINAFLES